MAEAREVADLGDQPERGERADPAEAGEGRDLAGPPLAGSDLPELGVERVELAFDAIEVDEQLLERTLSQRVIQALTREPRAMQLRPRRLAAAEDSAVAQQRLEHTVARRGPRAADVVAAAQQVSQSLKLLGRRMHEPQQAATVKRDELLRIAPIGLHTIAGADRH